MAGKILKFSSHSCVSRTHECGDDTIIPIAFSMHGDKNITSLNEFLAAYHFAIPLIQRFLHDRFGKLRLHNEADFELEGRGHHTARPSKYRRISTIQLIFTKFI